MRTTALVILAAAWGVALLASFTCLFWHRRPEFIEAEACTLTYCCSACGKVLVRDVPNGFAVQSVERREEQRRRMREGGY